VYLEQTGQMCRLTADPFRLPFLIIEFPSLPTWINRMTGRTQLPGQSTDLCTYFTASYPTPWGGFLKKLRDP